MHMRLIIGKLIALPYMKLIEYYVNLIGAHFSNEYLSVKCEKWFILQKSSHISGMDHIAFPNFQE